ncbi:MAG TPA: insulinase family protein [Actinomycetota bacterium]|nr:insulinase family protein [Actinomycetota bacterium]
MADKAEFNVGDKIGGYKVERVESLEKVNGTYYELTHEGTGARHIHISCDDDNNTFGVLFPTVPKDSTGVAHILEHTALKGSARFPVPDPFTSMGPRSLQTFMNALTASDWTMYPFSSRNEKDFFNLLDVYLDASFHPLLEEDAFMEQGIRLEFENPDDPNSELTFKGVVFNEMKGYAADQARVMYEAMGKAVFPDLTYANRSGGDPKDIPNLTWQALKDFHFRHYHPSNAFFFTYGDADVKKLLGFIEEKALGKFEKIDVDVSIPDQPRFKAPTTFDHSYPLAKEEDPSKKSQALVAWVTKHVGQSFDVLALKLLSQVLLSNAASPLRKALMDSGIGDALADGTGFHSDFREAVFAAGLKGVNTEEAGAVETLVLDTLKQVVNDGVDDEMVDAQLHRLEIEAREVSNSGYPFALKVFFELAGGYIYGGDPYAALQFDRDVKRLADERKKGRFFENLIQTELLDNTHRSLIVLRPDQELEVRRRDEEKAKLEEIQAKLTDAEKTKIVESARKLKERQEKKADLSSLPTLELSDIPMEFPDVPHEIVQMGTAKVGLFPQPTNGLTYVDIRAEFKGLPDELKDYLSLFAYCVNRMGAGEYDYLQMAQRIAAVTGGIGSGASVRNVAGNGTFLEGFSISGKALARNHKPFLEIYKDILTGLYFDPKRLKELIAENTIQREQQVAGAGFQFAMSLAAAALSPASSLSERLGGISQLYTMRKLAELEEGQLGEVIEKLNQIKDFLFRNHNLAICVTSEEKNMAEVQALLEDVLSPLETSPPTEAKPVEKTPKLKHIAKTTAVPVNYIAKVFRSVGIAHADAPALQVLGNLLRETHVHKEIREKGGAYFAHAGNSSENAQFIFLSGWDPNIVRTLQVFEEAVQEGIKGDIDPERFKEAVLSACGDVDPLESPDTKGRRRFFDEIAGYTTEIRQQYKRRLLEVKEADLRRVAETYLTKDQEAARAIVGNPELVEKANAELDLLFEVSPV